jgi:hypothetical protein
MTQRSGAYAAVLIAAAVLAGCASQAVVEPTVRTSEPRPVDPRQDLVNVQYLRDSGPALLVAVRINDRQLSVVNAVLAQAPKKASRERGGDVVTFTALSGNQPVGSVTVADQILNVQENKGIVLTPDRTIHAAIPIARRADAIEVRVSATGTTARLPISDEVYRVCEAIPNDPLCARPPR